MGPQRPFVLHHAAPVPPADPGRPGHVHLQAAGVGDQALASVDGPHVDRAATVRASGCTTSDSSKIRLLPLGSRRPSPPPVSSEARRAAVASMVGSDAIAGSAGELA